MVTIYISVIRYDTGVYKTKESSRLYAELCRQRVVSVIINMLSFCLSLSNLTNYKLVAFRSLLILNFADRLQAKLRISESSRP